MDNFVIDDNKGYVIRCVNRDTGRVLYRGSHSKTTRHKDSLRPQDTYTFTGAKKSFIKFGTTVSGWKFLFDRKAELLL